MAIKFSIFNHQIELFKHARDGGPESNVEGFWIIECKSLFSIVLLKFNNGSREAYHSHAFNAVSWYLSGVTWERIVNDEGRFLNLIKRRGLCFPKYTPKEMIHNLQSLGESRVLSFRGPWHEKWIEILKGEKITLTHGRLVVKRTRL